ncbi:uncharacterized protein ACOB7L_018497 isoform 1-T1 [Callospermophilus lateralis]|uniref:uncharacterized protein LOC143379104 n=1 Tax=Callospermophilus lateralis TaxID=76772 RepID=UPI00405437EE
METVQCSPGCGYTLCLLQSQLSLLAFRNLDMEDHACFLWSIQNQKKSNQSVLGRQRQTSLNSSPADGGAVFPELCHVGMAMWASRGLVVLADASRCSFGNTMLGDSVHIFPLPQPNQKPRGKWAWQCSPDQASFWGSEQSTGVGGSWTRRGKCKHPVELECVW